MFAKGLQEPYTVQGLGRKHETQCIFVAHLVMTPGFMYNEYTLQNYHGVDLSEVGSNQVL